MAERIRVLGTPEVCWAGVWRPLPLDLRGALVGVLAHAGDRVPRDWVAAVFWPDGDDRLARQNLRQLLRRTRPVVGDAIDADVASVRLACPSDLGDFRAAAAAGDADAVAACVRPLARKPLLHGLDTVSNSEFQAWLALERRALEEDARRALLAGARVWAASGASAAALEALSAWCDRDPFDEDLLTAYLELAAATPSERAPAAARVERVRSVFRLELDTGPSPAVERAADALTARGLAGGTPAPTAERAADAPDEAARRWADRRGATRGDGRGADLPFVGRDAELRELDESVDDPAVRLVTVHGIGGIGKTRLVGAWAATRAGTVPVVRLAGASGPDEAHRRIGTALGWRLDDRADAAGLGAILDRSLTALVLDEVEGLEWLPAWLLDLTGGGRFTVVVTSRELLGVPGEHVLRLGGLDAGAVVDAPSPPPALLLFLQAARRVRPDVHLDDRDRDAVLAFARRVGGAPLAIIVAAGWLQLGPAAVVLEELLAIDDDHLSFGAVLDPSWSRLEPRQRVALEALSVFPGRFTITAALDVAGADRRTVRALVDAALVEPGTSRGLALHPLVRADAERRLLVRPGARAHALAAHAAHVARTLGDRARSLYSGPDQLDVLGEVTERIDDVRLAWHHACANGEVEILDRMLDLVWAMELRGWYALGEELSAAAVAALEGAHARSGAREGGATDPRTALPLARALARRGIFAMRRGDGALTRDTALRARALFEATGAPIDAFVLFHLGIASLLEGDLDDADRWHRVLVEEAHRRGDTWAEFGARSNLAIVRWDRGDLAGAVADFEALVTAELHRDDAWAEQLLALNLARTLLELGGRDDEALTHAEAAVARAKALGSRQVELIAHTAVGEANERLGRRDAAAHAFANAVALEAAGALDDGAVDQLHARFVLETLVPRVAQLYGGPSHHVTSGVTPVSRPPS